MKKEFIIKMHSKYRSYRDSSEQKNLNLRLIENEKWYKMQQTELQPSNNKGDNKRIPDVHGGYLFNAIMMKHADAMDNYPDISVLPREESDKELAKTLSGVIPYILDRNDFESVYSDNWFSKLKTSSCYCVTWDSDVDNGKGDVKITKTDLLNLFWQPNVTDIQQSEFVFYHTFMNKKDFIAKYGNSALDGCDTISSIDTYEAKDYSLNDEFVLIVDSYYKIYKNKKPILHFAKFSGTSLLYSSEDARNDDGSLSFPNGYYNHGYYPFFFDVMYPAEQSVAGFGVVDVLKSTQSYIDSLETLIQLNNRIVGKPRYAISNSLNINTSDLLDFNKEVIKYTGSLEQNGIFKLPADPLPSQITESHASKVNELKEIIGNRDFQQGGTNSGVVSGTAISVLQSAGDKLSRDIIKSSYRCYKKIILTVIELIRQFYDEERTIRITGDDGDDKFIKFNNAPLLPHDNFNIPVPQGEDLGADINSPFGLNLPSFGDENSDSNYPNTLNSSVPMFDISLAVQKSNPYSRELNNQTILQLFSSGLLNPQNIELNLPILNSLQFDGKESLIKDLNDTSEKIRQKAESEKQAQLQAQGGINPQMSSADILTKLSDNSPPPDDELVEIPSVNDERSMNT